MYRLVPKLIRSGQTMVRTKLGSALAKSIPPGATPRKLALTTVLGVSVGVLPLAWGGTVLCAAAASVFRLNHLRIQAVNFCAWPLQLLLFIPFYRLGELLFPWGRETAGRAMSHPLAAGVSGTARVLTVATLKAVGAWLLVAPPAGWLLYLCLCPAFTLLLARGGDACSP